MLSLASGAVARKPGAQEVEPDGLQLRDPVALATGVRWAGADGTAHAIGEYAGRGVVLNFWATWCGPCVAELPSLARLAVAVAGEGIVVVPVSTDAGGAAAVTAFYAAHRVTGVGIWLDPRQAALEASGAPGLPTTLIIDRRGREVARVSGGIDWLAAAPVVRALCDSG